jgi:hypothetical protein
MEAVQVTAAEVAGEVTGGRMSEAQLAAFEKRRLDTNESSDPIVLLALVLATATFPVALLSWCCRSVCGPAAATNSKIYD